MNIKLDVGKIIAAVATGLLFFFINSGVGSLQDINRSIDTLNSNVAKILEKSVQNENRLNRHGARILKLEIPRNQK